MIYVEILGRIGNQMFSYAFARYLQEKLPNQKMPIAFDFSNFSFTEKDKNSLKKFKCYSNITESKRKCSFIQRILLKLYFSRKNRLLNKSEREVYNLEKKWQNLLNIFGIYLCSFNYKNFKFRPLTKNILLLGYFESAQFFNSIKSQIIDDFSISPEYFNQYAKELISDIQKNNSVCVGIRKGDFESSENHKYCSVCDVSYYLKAIKKMNELLCGKIVRYYFFSDDPNWVKQHIKLPENSSIIGDDKIDFDIKLIIMSKCKHFIISNSTYVWWAQYISQYPNKYVIAPDRWRNFTQEMHRDIYMSDGDDWTLIHIN